MEYRVLAALRDELNQGWVWVTNSGLESRSVVKITNLKNEKSSGNDIFDRRAQNAVQKASPLPVPDDIATFERLDLRDITFTFIP